MIKIFQNTSAYNTEGLPDSESRVALITSTQEVKIDGVNIITDNPVAGDAVFHDGNKYIFLKGGSQLKSASLPAGLTFVGVVFHRAGDSVLVIDKAQSAIKYANALQFAITAITSTSLTLKLKDKTGTEKTISITLTSAAINATSASEIDAAVKAANIDDQDWHAYLDSSRIIVACDTWNHYTQYGGTLTGGTMSFVTWEDMPVSDNYVKVNGKSTNYRGLMNIARGSAYWATSGRTLSANVEVGSEAGNTDPMKKSEYQESQYAAAIRAAYPTYEDYLRGEFGIINPQRYGCFGLASGKELTNAYGNRTARTKSGGTKYKYPAMRQCLTVGYAVDGLRAGSWWLPGVDEGCLLMADDTLAKVNATLTAMSVGNISNSAYRWFAQRCSVLNAWYFNGGYGSLYCNYVSGGLQVQAVTLLKIK